jgi:hypothetical protein
MLAGRLAAGSRVARKVMAKRIGMAFASVALLGACAIAFWPRERVIFPFGTQEYRVISARFTRKKNVVLASDWRALQLGRRLLDKVGVHMSGPRSDNPAGIENETGMILLLCEGPKPQPGDSSSLTNYILGSSNPEGRKEVMGKRWAWQTGPPGRVWFLFALQGNYVYRDLTNFNLTEFHVIRRSDGQELMRVPITMD